LDNAERALRRDGPATDAYATAAATGSRTWPVLARIGNVGSDEERGTRDEKQTPVAARRSYRVDSPHVTVANPPEASSNQPISNGRKGQDGRSPAARSKRYLHRLPGIIRFAIRTWLVLLPYRSLIRAAAMFVLMAITGASTMVLMGGNLQPESTPPNTTSAASEQPVPAATTNGSGVLQPDVEPVSQPEASATSAAPTALGPTSAERRELVAIEKETGSPEPESIAETLPVISYPTALYPTTLYPTTPYPVASLPTLDCDTMPRVQTTEPPSSVARFEGGVERVLPPR
jgi:hypothetical protein